MTFQPPNANAALVSVEGLNVHVPTAAGYHPVVNDVSFELAPGATLGVVGESGSGKSMLALSLLRLTPPQARIGARRLVVGGIDIPSASEKTLAQRLRGQAVTCVFQDPMTSLNPVYSIGHQLIGVMRVHRRIARKEATERALDLLHRVGIADPARRFHHYPHQFSGGQRQRIMIAMALVNRPQLLIADELTTALDVTVQRQILDLLQSLQDEMGMGLLMISHDLAAIAQICERVMVMKDGQIVERGNGREIFRRPQHRYTQRLVSCLPRPFGELVSDAPPPASSSAPMAVKLSDVSCRFPLGGGLWRAKGFIDAVSHVSLELRKGESLALVGTSGSGKSTLAKLLTGQQRPTAGKIELLGREVGGYARLALSQRIQPIFQDTYSSLNPRRTVGEIIRYPLDLHQRGAAGRQSKVEEMMANVGLDPAVFLHRYPNQLSGGQRQRVAIARALILEPDIVVCDEPTSALDVSIQMQILQLLADLRRRLGLTYLFVTHNLHTVPYVADRVAVMHKGRLVEVGPVADVLTRPQHDYTRRLLNSVLTIDEADGERNSMIHRASSY
ncbi:MULTISPECIES: ABC transporter ATP-binding protein [unclassified Brenneria]|uniref:ABC transporter ATP-binding protein n=1 Tax=unclassified Brenneria TaxID=2634434 RepID=UPI0029C1FB21|nr:MULTISPECIES: ABC transporter ATP-binding protein [unclassified Brenneria]MDX5629430.1 ABC transporter ATP-binding protein [Brenneria sp. L3-3Z]MDX5696569.1 ABC transporter ATP-binding protein [Brenneria sp. L4-2C]MEE3663394.1 ABC transporter ATP-binding protein [Brenneria sp. g21c3]